MSATTVRYRDSWNNPRLKIAALWASMLSIFVYVDLFSLFRADIRADLEAGKMFAFTVGQGFLLGATVYVMVPSLMVFLSLVLPPKVVRLSSIVLGILYAVTVAGGAVGESNYYYVLGSIAEVALLLGVVYVAWTWRQVTDSVVAPSARSTGTPVHAAPHVRR